MSKEVVVPDIGDFSDVPVIEVLVKAGDTIAQEDPLITRWSPTRPP
jgi:pyruvate/2-oxoglutarate dehydrogenase complex dihydrolipoamide acyltransferase (E2) component